MKSPILEAIRGAKVNNDWSAVAAKFPYARFLGLEVLGAAQPAACVMRFSDKLVGNPSLPALHGGTLGALLEATAVFLVLFEAEVVAVPKTINVTIEYLRPGKPVDTFATGRISRLGRRVAHVQVEAWQTDRERPCAIGSVRLLLEPPVSSPA